MKLYENVRHSLTILALSIFSFNALAQTPIEDEVFIWPETAPGSANVTLTEVITDRNPNGGDCYLNRSVADVTKPSLKVIEPTNPNGTAVILCPGGGYTLMAYDKEGVVIGQWLAERDITAFVLKYRLPNDGHENRQYVPLQDVQRAIRYVRHHAADYGVDPDKIGVMGGSAGGHLAATASVHYDKEIYTNIDDIDTKSAKPDFTLLMYPVVSFQDNLTHSGSRTNLLGDNITQADKDEFSAEMHVDANTPPAFLFHSKQDGSVVPGNSEAYASALTTAGVDVSLNLYESGGHGVGFCEAGSSDFARWPYDLNDWLEEMSLTTACEGTAPSVTASGDENTVLTSSAISGNQWYRNGLPIDDATDQTYTATVSGEYKVAINGARTTSASACILFSDEVVVDLCGGVKPSITELDDNMLRSSVSSNIQWYLDGEMIEGATDRILEVTENGEYNVVATFEKTFSGEACSFTSDTVTIDHILSVFDQQQELNIFPNPAQNELSVGIGQVSENDSPVYSVYDIGGKLVLSGTLNETRSISLLPLKKGTYVLTVTGSSGSFKGKFLKQ